MDNFDLLNAAVLACEKKDNIKYNPDDLVNNQSNKACKNLETCNMTEDQQKCTHSIITHNGNKVCEFCGLELPREIDNSKEWRYYGAQDTRHNGDPSRCHMRKVEERTINKDIENMGFSDKIIEQANSIYETVSGGKIYRGNSERQ